MYSQVEEQSKYFRSTAGALFIFITGGGGSSGTQVEACKDPLRTNQLGSAGSATINGTITSGTFRDSDGTTKNVTSLTSGPVGTFNQSGNGAAGGNNGNCGGDNCRIGGSKWCCSYAGNNVEDQVDHHQVAGVWVDQEQRIWWWRWSCSSNLVHLWCSGGSGEITIQIFKSTIIVFKTKKTKKNYI